MVPSSPMAGITSARTSASAFCSWSASTMRTPVAPPNNEPLCKAGIAAETGDRIPDSSVSSPLALPGTSTRVMSPMPHRSNASWAASNISSRSPGPLPRGPVTTTICCTSRAYRRATRR